MHVVAQPLGLDPQFGKQGVAMGPGVQRLLQGRLVAKAAEQGDHPVHVIGVVATGDQALPHHAQIRVAAQHFLARLLVAHGQGQ